MDLSGKPGLRAAVWDLKAEGGPEHVELWAVVAKEAVERDPERWAFELPPGMTPGSRHHENLARAAAAQAEAEKAKAADPHFGNIDKDKRIAELEAKLAEAQKPPAAPSPAPPRLKARPRGRPFKRKTPPAEPGATP